MDTEIALIKQTAANLDSEIRRVAAQLASDIKRVDDNCDERSKVSDAKIDRMQAWLIGAMGSIMVAVVLALLSIAAGK